MSALSEKVLATICSAVEYLVDRGEIEAIEEVLTQVRYTATAQVSHFDVRAGRKVVRIFAEELKHKPTRPKGSRSRAARPQAVFIDESKGLKIPLGRMTDLK